MDQAIASAPLEPNASGVLQPVLQVAQIRELMGSVPNAVFERLMESVSAGQSAALMMELDRLIASGNSPSALARQLVRYLRNCLMAKLGGENTQLLEIAQDERARAARTAQLFSEDDLTRNLQIALRTFDELNYRQEQRFHLELGLLKLIQAQRLLPMEEILSGLALQPSSGAPRRPASGPPTPPARSASSSAPPRPAPPSAPVAPSLSPFAASTLRTQQSALSSDAAHPAERLAQPGSVTQSGSVKGHDFSRADFPSEKLGALAPADTSGLNNSHDGSFSVPVPAPDTLSSASSPAASAVHETSGSLALAETAPLAAPQTVHETGPQIVPALASSGPSSNTDAARTAVVQALESGGHATAAAILDDGQWTLEAGSVKIEVMAKPTMIRITFNAVAEKLIRQALTQAGAPSRFLIVPGAALSAAGPAKVRAPQGSIEHEARNHPLVVQAQSVFNAEICSVIDLREK
jgi:DNA polymerase-3 subunit gamma/tau